MARFTDEVDGDVLLAEDLAVFLAHPIHSFAGGFHPVGTTDALREIVENLAQTGL